MRANCIQIHQETHEILLVADHIGEDINIKVKSADELRTHEETKTWDGMGRYAKELYDNNELWNVLPEHLVITLPHNDSKIQWKKEAAKAELLNCYQQLGGKNLY